MNRLVATYGRTLTALFWALLLVWLIALVLVPTGMMVESSLWRMEQTTAEAQDSLDIDRLYNDISVAELDRSSAIGAKAAQLDAKLAAMKRQVATLEGREIVPVKVYTLRNYLSMSGLHVRVFVRTLFYSALVTLLAAVVCYPVAYIAAFARSARHGALILLALLVPYSINELLRIYAWLMVLDYHGLLNTLLIRAGIVPADDPIRFLEYPGSVFLAMVYAYILFMVFPLYNTLTTLERSQIEAARDLGASAWLIHRRVVIPHAKPGFAVGCVMTFMLSAGSYSVPRIISRGTGGDWFTQLIYRQFYEAHNWNIGAAYAVTLLLACLLFIALVMASFRVSLRDIAR